MNVLKPFLLILIILFSPVATATEDWLLGNWILTFDPDEDTKDMLSFYDDGRFVTTDVATGKQINGLYMLRQGRVQVSLLDGGRPFMKLQLKYEYDRNKLFYTSEGTTSYYTKME